MLLTFFLFHACRRQYPDGNGSVPVSLASPSANGLPLLTGGSASVLPVSRPARRSLAFRPAWSLNRPRRPFSPECFSPCRYLHGPPWLLPTGATVVGRGSHPPEEGAFPRRTANPGVTSNADQRINVGVFNDSSDYKTFYAIVGDGNGNTVETITLRVPAKAWAQKPVTSRMENGIIGWGCAESSCSAYPWVVTVNNQSNDGSLAQPIVYRP